MHVLYYVSGSNLPSADDVPFVRPGYAKQNVDGLFDRQMVRVIQSSLDQARGPHERAYPTHAVAVLLHI